MAWVDVVIKTDSGEWKAAQSTTTANPHFSVPFASGINNGDAFEAGSAKYIAQKVVDLAQRGETLLVDAKEFKNDKSKARRSGDSTGVENPDGESDA